MTPGPGAPERAARGEGDWSRGLALNLLLAGIWTALMGSATVADLAVGFLLGYLILGALAPVLGTGRYWRKLPRAAGLAAYFLGELTLSSLRVARDVVTPRSRRRPAIIAVPLDAETDAEITLVANLVSLTPGTLSLDLSPDRRYLYVHTMFLEDPESFREEIKRGFERRVLELLR